MVSHVKITDGSALSKYSELVSLLHPPPSHSPVQHELLQLVQVAGDVLQRHVGDAGAPVQVQAAELAQVLGHQLHAVVRDLGAAGQAE